MAFRTITARFAGTCRRCGDGFSAGTRIRFAGRGLTYHLKSECGGGETEYRGRCEDAPCCGHERCGFGPGAIGWGYYAPVAG